MQEWAVKDLKENYGPGTVIKSEEEITIGNAAGIKVVPECEDLNCEYPAAYISKDSKIFKFDEQISGESEVFDQILSTFKFIEKDETADWKTYRNEKYGFEVKYPDSEAGWFLTTNITDPILAWAGKPIKPLDVVNLYTQRAGNPEADELSTTITFSVFKKAVNLSLLEWFSSAIPDMPKVKRGDLIVALQKANAGETGLLSYDESKDNDVEIARFGVVAIAGYFDYSTYFYKASSPYVYSVELNLPLRYVPTTTDPDKKYTDVYNQILSTFNFVGDFKFAEELFFISPKGMEQWRIGETHTIKINQPIKDDYPFTHLTLNKPNGEEIGIISCKIGGLEETVFDWDTKFVMGFCGVSSSEKFKKIEPGTYIVSITIDDEERPTLTSSKQFSITGE